MNRPATVSSARWLKWFAGLGSLGLLGFLPVPVRAQVKTVRAWPYAWPAATARNRPWTRWWWMGSAVDQKDLARQLAQFQKAGLGGVEICPIYGAHGYESRFVDFLSPRWMNLLAFTTLEARKRGLAVDLTTGTGWPPGGPFVSAHDASTGIILRRYEVSGGGRLDEDLPNGTPREVLAVSGDGPQVDLTGHVQDRRLDWTAPAGQWKVYAAVESGPVQKVKRPAPGGAGDVLDPFSTKAMNDYLSAFDKAFADYHGLAPRAYFIDSYEYFGANWTPDFFQKFKADRDYDLRPYLPALYGDGPSDTVARVKYDYRATIAELHSAYTRRWNRWAHDHGSLTRLQAHGSPTDVVDVYADADIPETEIFGSLSDSTVVMNKLSSSAAHLTGRSISSAESFTWLNEHFKATFSEVKHAADYLFLTGANLIVFQGIPYSPADAPWPGWQFYAAVDFGPDSALWRNLPLFNAYATRVQSVLQDGAPANDVLLYFPIHDVWQKPSGMLIPLSVEAVRRILGDQPFYATADSLWHRGFSYDVVTDRFLAQAASRGRDIQINGNTWKVVLVPGARLMPVATLQHLLQLARGGVTVLFQGSLPADVPGLNALAQRRADFHRLLDALSFTSTAVAGVQRARVGRGQFLLGADATALLQAAGVKREPMADLGLHFVRRAHADGFDYFIANRGDRAIDGWVTLGTPAKSALLLDPLYADRFGRAALRAAPDGDIEVYLQLTPGASCVLRTFTRAVVDAPPWGYREPAGAPRTLTGAWHVRFIDGGPALPAPYTTPILASWTARGDPATRNFSGTARYTLEFEHPAGRATDWLLDLGQVAMSARVILNGHPVNAFWCAPFRAEVGRWLKPGKNTLVVEVTNLAANRIADLDRRHVKWKYFYDINVVGRDYRPFDASKWPLSASGLLGPVTLTPLKAPSL